MMKRFFLIFFFLPLVVLAQTKTHTKCKMAYFHQDKIVDNLPTPPEIQKYVDSLRHSADSQLAAHKKVLAAQIKDTKVLKKKMKKAQSEAANVIKLERRKKVQKFYAVKIKDATLKIYDKGKKYDSVFNADSKAFNKIPPDCCDITDELLKLVKEAK